MGKAVVPSSIVFEVLEKDNYEDWSETIRAYLEFKDLWDVVDSNEQPPERDADEAKFKAWKKKNCEALHAIKISCGRHFLSKIRGIREANKAWKALRANFIPPLPRRMECTINPEQGDEEKVDDEYKKAYKSLAVAFSRSDISDAIQLCKKDPALLKERLPNYTPLLHELIILCTYSYEDKLVEILKLDHFPKEALEMRDSLGRTPLIAAVTVRAIGIARCLVDMNPTLIYIPDDSGLIPLAVAIDTLLDLFHMDATSMIEMLCSKTPPDFWSMEDGRYGATVITKCIEVWEFDFALKFINDHPHLIFAKDVNGISPLSAAARQPNMFSTHGYNNKFQKFISNLLRPCLPLHSVVFEISGIELLIAMRNAIQDLEMTTGLLREAFFEAIKFDNFNFLIMLINADKNILEEKNDMSKNIYMCAIEYRRAKVFSLIFWHKKDRVERKRYASGLQDKGKNNLVHVAATWTSNALDGISNPVVLMLREQMWYMVVQNLAPNLEKKVNVDGKMPDELFKESHRDLMMQTEKEIKNSTASWEVVGPLIITIMFAAAFQIPGGYNQEMSFPIFLHKKLFKFYMVLVSISLFSATISVLKLLDILSPTYQEKSCLSSFSSYAMITSTLFLSIATMLVAFCLGLFLTLHGELAIFLPITVIATFLVGYIVYTHCPLFESHNISRFQLIFPLFQRNIGDEVKRIFQMLGQRPTKEVAILV